MSIIKLNRIMIAWSFLRVRATFILLCIVIVASICLLYFPPGNGGPHQSQHNAQAAENETLSAQIVHQCAMGNVTEKQATISASLAQYLNGLSAQSSVRTSDIGAMIDKITPSDQGVAFYKIYSDCLKQQSAIVLAQKGIKLIGPSQDEIEAQKDEQVRVSMSEINPDVPKSRLVQILGAPIASGKEKNAEVPGITRDFYQYKHMLFVGDYYKGGNRIGLAIMTRDPIQGSAMFVEQIRGVTLASAAVECGGIETTVHNNARSGICGASHASNYINKVFLFMKFGSFGLKFDEDDACGEFALELPNRKGDTFDPAKCPGMASVPAMGVIVASNSVSDKNINAVAEAWLEIIDFGGQFSWRSPSEQKAFVARIVAYDKRDRDSDGKYDASIRKERLRRVQLPISPPIEE